MTLKDYNSYDWQCKVKYFKVKKTTIEKYWLPNLTHLEIMLF